ncbi:MULTISPECIES: ATP-binding protein [unclassified Colwellia]|uniref:ATP-binding protein n=1 Tax=unclassified Colwellia TaxID=196834 RepID=UPI0015F6A42E|nr:MULTISPECIES: ATP-binding protein [unclassified Colwellia]MBA6353480.1 response regulator [Colwellia sp. BRX9-1]MBA6357681.1 response regulator [Colwellia sp. BRX8-3]MBA6359838.1 response regulator [Colwellia sp. BRX8-6]MBA6368358.1 response regulator [Colwellia sp. BRX8-5]
MTNKSIKNKSIRLRIIFLIILVFTLVLVFFSYFLKDFITGVEQDLGKKMVLQHAIINKEKALSHFTQNLNLVKRSLLNNTYQDWMKNNDNEKFKTKAIQSVKKDCQVIDCYGWFILSIAPLTSIDWNKESNTIKTVPLKLEENSWLPKKLKENNEFYVDADINTIDGNTYVFFDYIVRENDQVIGTVGSYALVSTITNQLLSTSNQDILDVLIDNHGVFRTSLNENTSRYHPSLSKFLSNKEWHQVIGDDLDKSSLIKLKNNTNSHSVKTIDIRINEVNYIAAIVYIEEIEWYAMSLFSKEAMEGSIVILPLFLVGTLLLFSVIALTLYFLNKLVFKRLIVMNKSVNNIALGNYKDLIKDCRSDELGTLAQGINTMSQEISKNLSKIKSQNNALNDAIDKANAANNAKSIFLSNMSHEIRTPMNAVLGFAEIGRNTKVLFEKDDSLEQIQRSGEHLLQIINDVLDFSKIGSKQLELEKISFSFSAILKKITQICKSDIDKKNISLNFLLDDSIPSHLIGDPLKIEQIIINLVSNAIKFTEHGSIDINTRLKRQNENNVIIELSVKDTGIGITPEQQKNLFIAFSQADNSITRKFGGTGLGLAISKQLVEMMGGEITLKSERDKGTEFTFTIPLTYSTEKLEKKIEESADFDLVKLKAALYGKKILLVEDNRINQIVAKKTLEPLSISIDIAENGLQAVEKMKNNTYSLVLMDIQMPELDGLQATEQIRMFDNDTVIIGMSAHASIQDTEKAIKSGMNDYMTKPIKQKTVFLMISEYIF